MIAKKAFIKNSLINYSSPFYNSFLIYQKETPKTIHEGGMIKNLLFLEDAIKKIIWKKKVNSFILTSFEIQGNPESKNHLQKILSTVFFPLKNQKIYSKVQTNFLCS